MKNEVIAKALIFNKDRILVLRLGVHKQRPEKSHMLDLPGGVTDRGESEREALAREIQEETGILINMGDATLVHADTQLYRDEQKSVTKLLYVVRLLRAPVITLSWEHEAYEWRSVDALLSDQEFRSSYKKAVEYARDNRLL